ncbi:MAG: hypothetical protein Q9195_001891 [Heterodermia aff. obscurata]
MSAMQKSRDRQRSEDDSADELAGDPLLDNPAQQPMRSSLQSDKPDSQFSRTRSNTTLADSRNKPLPPIPATNLPGGSNHSTDARGPLTSKSTNRKIKRKAADVPARPNISHPVLQDSEDNEHNSALRAVYGPSNKHGKMQPQTSISDAEILSRKISSLMQQAAAREAEQASKVKDASVAPVAKVSPLQRSKAALSKATQAIAGRLSNSRRSSISQAWQPRSHELTPDGLLGFEYQAESKKSSDILGRENVVGSSIPRKPLPVYESMRSLDTSSESSENQFSDIKQGTDQILPALPSDFDFNFDKRKGKGDAPSGKQRQIRGNTLKNSESTGVDSQSSPEFLSRISGLSQHPDTLVFSSPPLGSSTPSARLKSPASPPATSWLNNTAQPPSVLDFSFEESDDDVSGLEDHESFDRSLSIKRKSAREDLRSQLSPSSKRARKSSNTSQGQTDLTSKLKHMNTQDNGPLIEKHRNSVAERPTTRDTKRKGLGIFETAKDIGSLDCHGDKTKRTRTRTNTGQRLSIPTPNSILFSRESRAHYRLRDTSDHVDHDSEDLDELQMADGEYSVKGTKNA